MLCTMKYEIILFTSAFYAALGFSMADFETYQPILARMPFGTVPDSPSVNLTTPNERATEAAKAALARQVNMSALNIMPDGRPAVGFTDLSAKPPVNYYLAVGESDGGWTVLDVDPDGETAKLEKEGIPIDLKLGSGLIESPQVPGRPGRDAANQAVLAAGQINMLTPPPTFNGAGAGDRPGPPGLIRGDRSSPATAGGPPSGRGGSAIASRGPGSAASTPASYTERRDARLEAEQLQKEKESSEQREQLIRLAAATAAEAVRKQKEEEAAAAEDPWPTPTPQPPRRGGWREEETMDPIE